MYPLLAMSLDAPRISARGSSWLLILALVPFAAVLIPVAARHMGDFPVYYQTSQVFLAGKGPLYGPNSGLGYPMYFRYPPLFLFVFLPFALLPLKLSMLLWAALKWVALYFFLLSLGRLLNFPRTGWWWVLPFLLSAPFLIEEFVGGNVQFLIFALTAAALILLRRRPWTAAAILALATCLKVWPLFFVPYIAARRRYGVAAACVLLIVILTALPALHFGWHGNLDLLHQWASQEWGTESVSPDLVFPSQSLYGTMQRYLTPIDYSARVDPNYRDVNFVSISPSLVRGVWVGLVILGYGALLLIARSRPGSDGWLEDSLAWCLLLILEPITSRLALVALLWPGMVGAAMLAHRKIYPAWTRFLVYAAGVLCVAAPLIPGAGRQRFLQVLGDDFWFVCMLTIALLGMWWAENRNAAAHGPAGCASP